MKIDLMDVLKKREKSPFQLGMTLNKFATYFHPPKSWTFPWTDPFGGSIDYGDLNFHIWMDDGNLILNSLGINMYDVLFDDDGDSFYVPKKSQTFPRSCRVVMGDFVAGLSISDVEKILKKHDFSFGNFGSVRATEIGAHIVADDFIIFNFYRGSANPWLMSINIFHSSHMFWPVSEGWRSS